MNTQRDPSKNQNPSWAVVILTLLLPGTGHFHTGHFRRAFGVLAISSGIIAFGTRVSFRTPPGLLITYGLAVLWTFAAAWDAKRRPARPDAGILPWYRRQAALFPLAILGFLGTTRGLPRPLEGRYQIVLAEGHSMEPTFMDGDVFVYDAAWFRSQPPRRQDIICFSPPIPGRKDWTKRLVALEGDVVEIRDQRLFLNGVVQPRLDNPKTGLARDPSRSGSADAAFGPSIIPDGMFFCLGDNWDASTDSRAWGPVGTHALRGKVLYCFYRFPDQRKYHPGSRKPWDKRYRAPELEGGTARQGLRPTGR
jgi:signal peptidase I